jgi:hypothetical protein
MSSELKSGPSVEGIVRVGMLESVDRGWEKV